MPANTETAAALTTYSDDDLLNIAASWWLKLDSDVERAGAATNELERRLGSEDTRYYIERTIRLIKGELAA